MNSKVNQTHLVPFEFNESNSSYGRGKRAETLLIHCTKSNDVLWHPWLLVHWILQIIGLTPETLTHDANTHMHASALTV